MTETMTTSEVLNRAADLIEERGWATGLDAMSANPAGPICLEGALAAITDLGVRSDDPRRYEYPSASCPVYMAVHNYLSLPFSRLFTWNDAIDRTAAEVIEVLRACAVIESARERQPAEVAS
jgi:hypothetical protein